MDDRRQLCTSNDAKYRIKKEEIDTQLGGFDKEFNAKLNQFKMINSPQYSTEIEGLPTELCKETNNMLQLLGFSISNTIILKQIELIRILEQFRAIVRILYKSTLGSWT